MAVWEYFTNQKQWKLYIKNLLKTNNNALLKAILLIYDNQTEEEKNKGESIEDNCTGFNKVDAKEMGKIAIKIKAGKALTEGELAKSRNKMQKYWKQLMIISKQKQRKKILQEQMKIESKLNEYEYEVKLKQFREYNEIVRKCNEGIQCAYGICDECPNILGNEDDMK